MGRERTAFREYVSRQARAISARGLALTPARFGLIPALTARRAVETRLRALMTTRMTGGMVSTSTKHCRTSDGRDEQMSTGDEGARPPEEERSRWEQARRRGSGDHRKVCAPERD